MGLSTGLEGPAIFVGGRNGKVQVILDAGPAASDWPSTVLDLTTTPWLIRRVGPITPDAIRQVATEDIVISA